MMNGIRRTGLLFLASLVLLSTTGFTVWHHICHCHPAAAQPSHPSCCETEGLLPGSGESSCMGGCKAGHAGCRDVPVYFRASIIAVPQVKKEMIPVFTAVFLTLLNPSYAEPYDTELLCRFDAEESPPRLTGKALVYFLQQLRIPLAS